MKKTRTLSGFLAAIMIAVMLLQIPSVEAYSATTQRGSIAKGIDVSKYQGNIDWGKVAASGVKFAFIRIGTMIGGMDPYFLNNIQQAQAHGIQVGVYIYSYAKNVNEATVEAMLVTQWLSAFGLQLPVAYDVEDKVHQNIPPAELANMINTFCILVDAAGYTPIVYTYKNFYQSKIGATLWDKWIAQYGDSLNMPDSVAFWQYSSNGSVPGINGRVDMNYQYKDYSKTIIKDGFIAHNGSTRFYNNWKMQIGWIEYQGKKYFSDVYGYITKGWFASPEGMYFFDLTDGAMQTGLVDVSGLKFYFGENGIQQYGFVDYGAGNKYFDPLMNGAMATTWFAYDGKMHYADKDGNQAIGKTTIEKADYFFKEDGSLAINETVVIDGASYIADATGVLTLVPVLAPEGGEGVKPMTAEEIQAAAATGQYTAEELYQMALDSLVASGS